MHEIRFEETNYEYARYLDEFKFKIIWSENEPEGFSVYRNDCNDNAYSVVSSIPDL